MSFEFKIAEMIEQLKPQGLSLYELGGKLGLHSRFELTELKKVLDKMAADGSISIAGGKKEKYTYLNTSANIRGVLRGNKRGFAFLIREDGGEDLFLPNKGLKGAQHGDTVYVRIVRGDEAVVTKIVERGISRVVGTYQKNKSFGFVVVDDNSYYTDIFIPTGKNLNCADHMKVVVEIDRYGERNPEGHIVEIIGTAGEKASDVLSILKSYGFFNVFTDEALEEARHTYYLPTANRTDYKDLPTMTIDGEESKDLDDAVSLVKVGEYYKLYVHIADVSHYVPQGGALDKEAFKRCTSVYFPGNVYPMLPPELSNGICSLNEHVDRLTLTAVMVVDKNGNVIESEINKSIINNDHRMTYTAVTGILEGDKELRERYSDIVEEIELMAELARILKNKRISRGSLEFETTEAKIILDEKGDVEDIKPYPYGISNGIIEEFMLLANETVAQFMCKTKLPFVYRVHETPDAEKMADFRKFVGGCGRMLPAGKLEPKDLQKLLKEIDGDALEPIISKVMLRSMKKARYCTENLGHFGLAAEYYCHFTSPIRRYPDLQIHRVIKAMIDEKLGSIPKLAKWCEEVAVVSSEREKASESAERDIDDYYKAEYMQRHVGSEFMGIVSGVTSFGVFVELENTCEGLARLDNLPRDNYNFLEERFTMVGAKHSYTLGQKVKIRVEACDIEARRVTFKVLED